MQYKNTHAQICSELGYEKQAQQVEAIFDQLAEATREFAAQNAKDIEYTKTRLAFYDSTLGPVPMPLQYYGRK